MTALLVLQNISYATADGRDLFPSVNLSIGRERTGLIGRNGVGKSTLLRLVTGELVPATGTITRAGSIGVLSQSVQVADNATVAQALGIDRALAVLARVISGHGSLADADEADWTLETRLSETLAQVGLHGLDPARALATLSGGQRTRLRLAALVLRQPDLILLDEPTNNLDRDGRDAVVQLMSGWRGGALVVSHDRTLLRQMDRIVELSTLGAKVYGGGFDLYRQRKDEEVAAAEHAVSVAERRVRDVERQAQATTERQARRDAAGKRSRSSVGQSKMLLDFREDRAERTLGRGSRLADRQHDAATDDLQDARAKLEVLKTLTVEIAPTHLPPGKTVLDFDHVTGGPVPELAIIKDLSFAITGPERVAVVGRNGSGKTTLLRLATGALAPTRGTIRRQGRIAMLDQQVDLLAADQTILDNFKRLHPASGDNACRAALARFLFRADAALRNVGELSGGEMLRAGLACVLSGEPPDLLILDEPTNHLDLSSIAAVEAALNAYDGALLVVSHDEAFLDAIGVSRRLEL